MNNIFDLSSLAGPFLKALMQDSFQKTEEYDIENSYNLLNIKNYSKSPLNGNSNEEKNILKYMRSKRQPQKSYETFLRFSCAKGYFELVNFLVHHILDLNAKDDLGITPLIFAASYGKVLIVEYLLRLERDQHQCVNIDEEDNEGRTALSWACSSGQIDSVKCLLFMKANINIKCKQGKTPLMYAIILKRFDIAKVLIKFDPKSINEKDNYGNTALTFAACYGYDEIVRILILINADLSSTLNNTIAKKYIEDFRPDTMKLILKAKEKIEEKHRVISNEQILEEIDEEGRTQLIKACAENNYGLIDALLQKNCCNIEAKDKKGMTALNTACINGSLKVIYLLLRFKADPNTKDIAGDTPLHNAARNGNVTAVSLLLSQGVNANVDATNNYLSTPLFQACMEGHLEVVKALISHRANKEAKDFTGKTPLIIAAIKGHAGVVQYLIDLNANKEAEDRFGKTAQKYAEEENNQEIIQILKIKQYGPKMKQIGFY